MTEIFAASAPYATRSFGQFTLYVTDHEYGDNIVLARGQVADSTGVLCRVTSHCVLSTALDASDCDCAQQIQHALAAISEEGLGVLVYLDQEGRGHGLSTKVRAINFKHRGYDTYTAFEAMGLNPDVTTYEVVPKALAALGVKSVRLLSNNPWKREQLQQVGVVVDDMVPSTPSHVPAGALRHLRAKKDRGHTIDLTGDMSVS